MLLLSLPVELRLEIYRQLLPTLCNDKLVEVSMLLQNCSYALDENVDMTWACDKAKDYIGLLSTCRTIRAEMSIMINQFDVVLHLHESILNRDVRGAYYAASHLALQLNLPWQYCNKIHSEATWSGETRFTRVHSPRSALPAVLWHDLLECYEWVISILTSCAPQPVVKKLSFTLNTPRTQIEMGGSELGCAARMVSENDTARFV